MLTGAVSMTPARTETRVKHDRDRAWVGIDVGKTHHWACVVDHNGATLLSAKVANDEAEIGELICSVGALAQQPVEKCSSIKPRRRRRGDRSHSTGHRRCDGLCEHGDR